MGFRRAAILIVMDVFLLADLTFAIWWAHFEPAAISWRFLQVFVPPLVPILLATRWALKRWAPKVEVSPGDAGSQPFRPVNLFGALGDDRPTQRRQP